MISLTATEAARAFSAVLDRASAGQEIEVTRDGAPVAVIGPAAGSAISPSRLRDLHCSPLTATRRTGCA